MFGRDFGRAYGGDEVLYNSKYVIEIVDSDMTARAKYGSTARRILLIKHPYNAVTRELYPTGSPFKTTFPSAAGRPTPGRARAVPHV